MVNLPREINYGTSEKVFITLIANIFFLGCFVQFAVLQILEQPLCFVVQVVLGTPLQLDPVHLLLAALTV